MVVDNRTSFILNRDPKEWILLLQEVLGSVCVRNVHSQTRKRTSNSQTHRFLEVPSVYAEYTYIADIDIFITESVLDKRRLKQMATFNLPYSNIIRPGKARLTGVMLVRTRNFFTPAYKKAQDTAITGPVPDEMVLYDIVSRSGHGLPPATNMSDPLVVYRPTHGLHLSLNRGPGKPMCQWGLAAWCGFLAVRQVGDMLCAGSSGVIITRIFDMVIKQERGNMTHKGGTCS
mmetsp:Transcript_10376/g.22000  ORF Transcript_10376/g.22000 Transcript_10376/m.22000 type:complete len:231 (+) Transcript_10376:2-694(+)